MIKLPNEMVIYPQSEHNPGYLLCWISSQDYAQVAASPEALGELQRFHPDGLEIPLTREALQEYGLRLPVSLEALRRAYLGLLESRALGEQRMVKAGALIELARQVERNELAPDALSAPESFEALDPNLRRAIERIDQPPEMKGDEDAEDVFRRMSASQGESSAGREGGA